MMKYKSPDTICGTCLLYTSGPGVKTGLNIMMDNPGQLGADQVADAVAGIAGYPVPLILIDMGTATTASVVNSKKQYVCLLYTSTFIIRRIC